MLRLFLFALLTVTLGCGGPTIPPTPAPNPMPQTTQGGHSHEKGKMLIADFGPYHALLTAHLSKSGHDLHLFVESAGADANPVAIPVELLQGRVQVRRADGGVREIEFRPAPADERPPGEAGGTCSHFVAKVPWLEPDTEHRVILETEMGGEKIIGRWNSFVPRKYAHHED